MAGFRMPALCGNSLEVCPRRGPLHLIPEEALFMEFVPAATAVKQSSRVGVQTQLPNPQTTEAHP